MPIQSITLNPGETFYLPKTAKILSKTITGDADVISECIDLDDVAASQCFRFQWAITENSGSETQAWEDSDAGNIIKKIVIGGVVHLVTIDFNDGTGIMDAINELGNGVIVATGAAQTTSISDIDTFVVYVRMPEALAANTYLGFSITHTADSDIRIYPSAIECAES